MKLLNISLIISITGMLLLLILSLFIPPKKINSYSELKLNEYVQVQGKIQQIRTADDFSIIQINNLTITCSECNFKQGDKILAIGKVSEYEGKKQVSADLIKILR